MSLTSKSVLVTGAASGLGKSIALAFLTEGAHVTLCDFNKSTLHSTSAELANSHPDRFTTCVLDIRNEASVSDAFSKATAASPGKRIDVLVNNAGVMDAIEPAHECELNMWERVIGTNLTGTYLCTKEAVKHFLSFPEPDKPEFVKQYPGQPGPMPPTRGSIINISSTAGLKGGIAGAAYTASKHGVLGLTKNTAAFYASKGIRCNAVLPGGMATNVSEPVRDKIKPENFAVVGKNMAMEPGLSSTEEVARFVVGMCGNVGCLNGAVVPLDGGWSAA